MNWKDRTAPIATPENELKSLLVGFQTYMEEFEMRFSNLVSQVPCLEATEIDFNITLRSFHNILVLMDSSVKLKRFVENRENLKSQQTQKRE